MAAKSKEARTVGAVPSLKCNDNRAKICNSQTKPEQWEYPDGWSRWVEAKTVWHVDEFLELWAKSIAQRHDGLCPKL